jgi:hypothetical protein
MRIPALLFMLTLASVSPSAAQMTTLERQRLLAHLEMTASMLTEELDGLSSAQSEFRPAPGSWTVLQVLDHLVVVGDIYWEDLRKGLKTPLNGRPRRNTDADLLWYGIDRGDREVALASELPRGDIRSVRQGLDAFGTQQARLVDYVRTTRDDLRDRYVERQRSDAYQWALLISTHVQRHVLQIRAIKTAPGFPSRD